MTPSFITVWSFVLFAAISPWYSCGLQNNENREASGEASGEEPQFDPIPDPAGSHCQRNKNPKGLGFIGVKYNLLKGNPEGKTELGGVDPGLEITRKILKLTNDNGEAVPDQICYEPRQVCSLSKSAKIFGGTKRYQEKLNVDVTAKGGYEGLFDFSFSLSSKYEKVSKSTSKGETVYRDCTEVCNKGTARYRTGEAQANQWTLTDEIAFAVCELPIKYKRGDEYFQFLEDWGTHVVIKVILGTKTITRFRSTLQEFMNFASETIGGSVSVSAGYGGATGEVSVDVNKYEEEEKTNSEFGEEQLSYKIGGDDFPEPIQLELMSIEETLDDKFWGNLDELKKKPRSPCKRMNRIKLPKQKKNLIRAIKDYPRRMKVKRAKDNPMKLRLSWPAGYYALYTAKANEANVCPQETGFQWSEGSATDRNRFFYPYPPDLTLSKIGFRDFAPDEFGVKFSFCSKTENPSSEYFSPQWPAGRYCILRKSIDPGQGKCPPKFETAYVKWNDEGLMRPARAPIKSGEVPDGEYGGRDYMVITYCCRRDKFHTIGMHLPIDNPFILLNVAGNPCQKVCGAKETPLAVRTTTDKMLRDERPSSITGKIQPAGQTSDQELELRYCYYQKMDDVDFVKYELVTDAAMARTAEKKCVEKKGHLVSIHSQQENDKVKNKMGNIPRVWIGLKRRTVQNRPWIWFDDTEVDFGDWKPDVTDDQNFVSMSADGSWEAQLNSEKLPFVCKIIDDCPLSS